MHWLDEENLHKKYMYSNISFFLESEYGESNKTLIILESKYGESNKTLYYF